MFNPFKKKKEEEKKALEEKYKELDSTDEIDPADIPDSPAPDPEEELREQESAPAEENVSADEIKEPAKFANPKLLELIKDFNDKKDDKKYQAELWFTIAHSRFLLPIHFTEKPEIGEDGVARFAPATQVAFPNLTDPSNPEKHILPVFTDYETLSRWKSLMENDGGKPEVTAVTFQDIVVIVGNKLQGFAVNPFGPNTLTLGTDAIEMIKNLPGYRAEMERAKQIADYRKEHKDGNMQVAILVPKETAEEKEIERILITAAGGSDDIDKIGLVVTKPQIEHAPLSYLCIVDCNPDKAQDIFKQIGEQVKPHLNTIKRMDFVLESKCGFAEKYFSNHPYIYPPF